MFFRTYRRCMLPGPDRDGCVRSDSGRSADVCTFCRNLRADIAWVVRAAVERAFAGERVVCRIYRIPVCIDRMETDAGRSAIGADDRRDDVSG